MFWLFLCGPMFLYISMCIALLRCVALLHRLCQAGRLFLKKVTNVKHSFFEDDRSTKNDCGSTPPEQVYMSVL